MTIRVRNLKKQYQKTMIFNNFSYIFHDGIIYLFTNENGSGKTTFFYCLLDEIKYQGSIFDNHYSIAYLPDKINFPLFISLDKFINLWVNDYNEDKYLELLKMFDMEKYRNKMVAVFSKGMKQKTLIIKTLLDNSDVLIFDEPLSGLDQKSREQFIKYLPSIKNKIIFIATHYLSEYKSYLPDKMVEVVSLV